MKLWLSMTQLGLAGSIHALGRQSSHYISIPLPACDLMVQRSGEGVASPRSSVMAMLAHWRAVISAGDYTEPVWPETGAVAIAPAGGDDTFYKVLHRLATDEKECDKIGLVGWHLYNRHFALPHMLAALHRVA